MTPIHPKLVHFPVALLISTLVFLILAVLIKRKGEIFKEVFKLNLFLGTIASIVALISGLLAEKTLVHNNAIHELMEVHEKLCFLITGIFICLSVWLLLRKSVLKSIEVKLFIAILAIGVIILAYSAHIGGKMVYEQGAGVIPMEEMISSGHNHLHDAAHEQEEGHEHEGHEH